MLPCLQEVAGGVVLNLRVQPRSSRNQLLGLQGNLLKIKLCSPPVDGAANESCCKFLAKLFGVSKGRIELVAGERSRQKRILLRGFNLAAAAAIIEANL